MKEDEHKAFKRFREKHRKATEKLFKNNTSIQSKLKLKGVEKVYFHLWFALKSPAILVHAVVSVAAIIMAVIQEWQLEIVLAIFSLGVLSVLAEDVITVCCVKKFRTKYYKSNGKELTSKNHTKGEVMHKVVTSGVITVILLYFVNDQELLSNWKALLSFLPAIIYAVFMLLVSTVRLIVTVYNSDKGYDLSLTMGRRIFQPFGLLLLLWLIFGLGWFSSTTGPVVFLIIYAVIRYFGLVFSSFMTLDDNEESKLKAELEAFIKEIRTKSSA